MEDSRLRVEEQIIVKDRVSIVTPVFNGEFYLSSMLDSVLCQTYPYIEMVLVDDGSTDQTLAVAESYRQKFADREYTYRIIKSKHKNASAAINKGLPYVTGEYLIWPDSDDVLKPDSVKKRVQFLKNNPQYQCVRSLAYYFDARTGKKTKADEKTGDLSKEELFWDILEFRTFVCCGCYMLRSETFFEIFPERHIPEYNVGQNFQMLLPFMYYHKCPTLCEQLYGVCVREGSHSRTKLSQREEEQKYKEYEELVDEIADICNIKDKESRKRILYWKARRKYAVAVKYRNNEQTINAICLMGKCGKLNFCTILKDRLWIGLEDTWVIKKAYPLYRQLLGDDIDSICLCKRKIVALTFDDGYGYASQILHKLSRHQVKATFFLCGDWLEKNPEDCRKISEGGHEIGNHSYSHTNMLNLSDTEICREIDRTERKLEEITGKESRLFRFPYGKSSRRLTQLVERNGLLPVRWSVDSNDWRDISAEKICSNIINNKGLDNGAIILFHTNHQHTAEALDLVIPALKRMGYQMTTVSELIGATGIYRYKMKSRERRK